MRSLIGIDSVFWPCARRIPLSQQVLLEDKALYGLSNPILIIGRDNHRGCCLDLRSTKSLHWTATRSGRVMVSERRADNTWEP